MQRRERLGVAGGEPERAEALLAAFARSVDTYNTTVAGEAWKVHQGWAEQFRERYSPGVWQRLGRVHTVTPAQVGAAEADTVSLRRTWTAYFAQQDFLVLAASPTAAPTKAENDRLAEILAIIRMEEQQHMLGARLSHGQKQWLEIGMLLAQNPKLLLVDEPVAGMTDNETRQTAELLKEINRDKTVIVVEHDMTFVRELGVKVTCLHEGTAIAEGTIDQVSSNERVIEVYLGRYQCSRSGASICTTARRRRCATYRCTPSLAR